MLHMKEMIQKSFCYLHFAKLLLNHLVSIIAFDYSASSNMSAEESYNFVTEPSHRQMRKKLKGNAIDY